MSDHRLTRRSALRALAGSVLVGPAAVAGRSRASGDAADETVEVNVGYASESGRDAAVERASTVLHEFGFGALTARLPASAAADLERRSDVRYVEETVTVGGIASPRPQTRRQAAGETVPYGVELVGADVALANGLTGAGADVAVVDTGVDATHPDIAPNLGDSSAFVPGIGDVTELGLPDGQDDDVLVSHGTHVAGVVGAVDNEFGVVGVSPDATLHAVKVLVGVLGAGPDVGIAAGIELVADRGWDVANLSLGGAEQSAVVADAVRDAHNRGVLLVAAAGNDGLLPTDVPASDGQSNVSYPAGYDEVLAVSATDQNDELAAFSSTGPEVNVAAPGVDVLSTALPVNAFSTLDEPVRRYIGLSGTSFAAPYVASAGALLMSEHGLSNVEARERLLGTAVDVGLSDAQQGSGRLDVAAALGLD